ncbi:MAG: SET domain-containing protein-lysine N-methyltransferase, partial [Pseudomonas sp.]
VLGPYAGQWLDNEGQKREEAKIGEGKLYSYSFNLPNQNAIISGFGEGHGNLTTLLNDADNPTDNNVGHIWLGKNLVFLVAKRPIKQGQQLLLDYGGTYDRSGWEAHPIKVEAEEPTASDQ